ncbi:hypothetical protein AX17_005450 [Amanita inopinata Kibby_2008]|nr:hypothetical protein AX17_005450 [Amanita inopinata Kibby_2008]
MTSLAAQLTKNASLNSAILVDRSRRKPRESYLFTGKEAEHHDLESLHALGLNGLIQLSALNPALREFEGELFSEHAKSTDRTLLSAEVNAELDKTIAACLSLLGPYLLESPTNKVLEWLVRRFRINEFNVDEVLALFLPYHETPHFAKMITILHIKPNSLWSFLLPYKTAAQSLHRLPLVTEMLRNTDVARFVTSLLPFAIKENRVHRVLLTFNAATLHDFITRSKNMNEGTVAFLLPALLEPLQSATHRLLEDSILGTYVLLAAFSQKCLISASALKTIISAMTSGAAHVSTRQFLTATIAVCAPQDQQERFSEKTSKAILRLPSIDVELRNATKLVGFERLLCPLLNGLTKKMGDEMTQSFMSSLLTYPDIPRTVVEQVTRLALKHVLSSEVPQTELRPLLSSIHQRHPQALRLVSEEIIEDDESMQTIVQQLLISLTLDLQSPVAVEAGGEKHDMVIASASAESNVRMIAVTKLLETLSDTQLMKNSELEAIQSALISRVQDTDVQVLETLYGKPSSIVPLLVQHAKVYIDTLAQCLCSTTSKPKRNLLKVHLTFLTKDFCGQAGKNVVTEVVHRIFFPFLLFSKPKQHTAEMVWDVIKGNMKDSSLDELLHGCASLVEEAKGKNEESVQMMSGINMSVASRIARNILMSNDNASHFDMLLLKLQDENPHAQTLGHLILRALLKQLSGEHQIDAVHKVLEVIGSSGFQNFTIDTEDLLESLEDQNLGKHIVVKPSSKSTLHWLQVAIISTIPTISTPSGVTIDWAADLSTNFMDLRGQRYVELLRTVYYIANKASASPVLSTSLLHVLFINLKDDALAFLMGIWSGADKNAGDDDQLLVLTLHHASAFLQAHIDEDDGVDFQTIVPSLLVVLSSRSTSVRHAALKCVSQVSTLAQRRLVTVYKFDAIYGSSGRELQYLDQGDLNKYLIGLNEESDHIMHDNAFVRLFHERYLQRNKTDKKKEYEHKYRVLCYLLSHIQALSLPTAQVTLLRLIENVSDKAKARLLSPVIKELEISRDKALKDDGTWEELTALCISCFDKSVANELNEGQSDLWSLYISVLRRYFSSGMSSRLHTVLSVSLGKGLFASLNQERKVSVWEVLLEIGAHDFEMYGQCKKLLASLTAGVQLIVHLLSILQPTSIDAGSRASKRPRTSDSDPGNNLRQLTLLVEVLGTTSLPGSLDLISKLLDTLNRVAQSISPTQADVNYIEQLLISAIENAAEKISETRGLVPTAVRLDILVDLIRVSDNPQTFHQALLLISKLSRLAPESVLHNVMPIFTFMGSNVFHRDDTYSFNVVQQTIESIVPVMVSSLKQSHINKIDLYIASRDFLRVFTDAANHIPRHRRNNFFSHLVDVLGPSEFLAPVCMLIVEKVANRVVRQSFEDAKATLALPISIIQHSPNSLQLHTLTEILYESQRLASLVLNSSATQATFLDSSIGDDSSRPAGLKRQARALISFVGIALAVIPPSPQVSSDGEMGSLVSALISLAALQDGSDADAKVDDIRQAATSAMSSALTAMSAANFITSVLVMIESQEQNVQSGALDLLGERLPLVADSVRQEMTPKINSIVGWIHKLVMSQSSDSVVQHAFRGLRSIGLSLQSGEESSVTEIIPPALIILKQQSSVSPAALASLVPLSTKLGPRIIPYLRELVAICVDIISNGVASMSEDAYAILHSLLVSVPTFWGPKEFNQVVNMFTKHRPTTSNGLSQAMSGLAKALTKRAPSKILLSCLIEMWTTYKASSAGEITGYFEVLTRTLRAANRPLVSELLRPLTKMFLESFDVASGGTTMVESHIILAFKQLVVKLNEAQFKPIYRRAYDWAFASDSADIRKKVTFCHMYTSLLDFFKALMTPYTSFLLQPFIQDIQSFHKASLKDKDYWVSILDVITKSLNFDDGAYWRDDKLRQISKPLITQVSVCIDLDFVEQRQLLQDCLSALVDTVSDDTLLKSVNLDLLMHTRSEDVQLRIYALSCSELLWRNHGGKLHGFVAETATFIAECNEDDNDLVVKESLKLKDAVENVAGRINGL